MFEDVNKIYFISAILAVYLVYLVVRHFRPKTWVTVYRKNSVTSAFYMDYEREGEAAELHSTQAGVGIPVARVFDESKDGEQLVRIPFGELTDESTKKNYRLRGYIMRDGLIYKKQSPKSEPTVIGYTARASKPSIPTVRGERTWRTLWLESELEVYSGAPDSSNPNANKKVAHVYMDGITPFRDRRVVSTEAKAGTAALLYTIFGQKEEKDSVYSEPSYGWNDTALLTSIVYSVLFMILYFVYTCLFHRSLLGKDIEGVFLLFVCYFLLCAVIGGYKIHRIEASNSFQPQLDMLNKGLSLGKTDAAISALGAFSVIYAFYYYDCDFLPLLMAVTFGVGRNGLIRGIRKPWKVVANYDEENVENQEEKKSFAEVQPPDGGTKKTFSWDLDSRCAQNLHSEITVSFDMEKLNQQREQNPFYSQRTEETKRVCVKQMFQTWLENRSMQERTNYIARYMEQESSRNNMEEIDRLQYLLDFVQEPNIAFMQSKESKSIQYAVDYMRYPDETLFDQEGSSDCKAFLAAALLHAWGYNVLYVASTQQQHSAVAIELNSYSWLSSYFTETTMEDKAVVEFNRRRYIYCETSGDGFFVGNLVKDMHIEDFDIKVELPLYWELPENEEESEI